MVHKLPLAGNVLITAARSRRTQAIAGHLEIGPTVYFSSPENLMSKYQATLTTGELDLLDRLVGEFPGQLRYEVVEARERTFSVHTVEVLVECDSITLMDYVGYELDKLKAARDQLSKGVARRLATTEDRRARVDIPLAEGGLTATSHLPQVPEADWARPRPGEGG